MKRSVRYTVAGNIQGYLGGKAYRFIGTVACTQSMDFADAWVAGKVGLDAGVWDQLFTVGGK